MGLSGGIRGFLGNVFFLDLGDGYMSVLFGIICLIVHLCF